MRSPDWGAYGSVGRFVWAWSRDEAALVQDELELVAPSGARLATTRFRRQDAEPGPAWILIHGLTSTGRHHHSLVRLARGFAASGATVVIPEVRAWTELELAPRLTDEVVLAGLDALEADPLVRGRPGLIGFSFGGAQALRVAGLEPARGRLSCVGSLGGYADIGDALQFLFTGEIAHAGGTTRLVPDSYGLWVIALNYLDKLPGYERCGPVLDAMRSMCIEACDRYLPTWGPGVRRLRAQQRARLDPEHWPLFDLLAPAGPGDAGFDRDWARRLAQELAEFGLAHDPELRFPDGFELDIPAFLIHGRDDDLSPFTQTLALAEAFEAPELHVEVSGLLAHSQDAPWPKQPGIEALRLARLFARMLERVRAG